LLASREDRRDHASASLLREFLKESKIEGRILELLASPAASENFPSGSLSKIDRWSRIVGSGQEPWFWPARNRYEAATLRLPRSKKELEMLTHLALSCLYVGCPLWIYGANDEGIKSVEMSLKSLAQSVTTVAYGKKCRVVEVRGLREFSYRGELDDWKNQISLDLIGIRRDWVSYPGVFAKGCLDPGTEVLIDSLPLIPRNTQVLDFGCGSGLVGGAILLKDNSVSVDFLDIDRLALEAVKKNMPGAKIIASDGYSELRDRRYDLIVSNPPYHKGRNWSDALIKVMVEGGVQHLNPEGRLIFVVQRRLKIERLLVPYYKTIEVLADRDLYRVWSANL